MAATDERAIHEFPTGTIDENSLLIMDRPTSTPGEYETEKFAIANLGLKLLGGIDFPSNLDTEEKDIFGAINELHSSIGADAYDSTATYNTGDYCIHNSTLYICNDDNVTGTWDAQYWDDTTITNLIETKVNKSGDDITGTLTYKTDINPSTTPSANKGFNIVALDDDNNDQLLRFEAYQNTANTIRGQMVVSRKVGNNTILNYFNMGIKADGTKDVTVSEPALWQEAIGIKVLSATDNITVSGGKNRFSHIFNAPSGYTYIGYSVSWSDSAIASTDYDFSSLMFGTNQIFVNIVAPTGASRQGTLTYKMIYLKN